MVIHDHHGSKKTEHPFKLLSFPVGGSLQRAEVGHFRKAPKLKGLRRVSDITLQAAYWMGVAPDDYSLLLTRDMGTQEIYALNLKVLLSDLRHR
jgi:hypothetical protein